MSERWFVGEDAARDARRCHRRSWAATRASYWTHICLPLPRTVSLVGLAYQLILLLIVSILSITLVHPIVFSSLAFSSCFSSSFEPTAVLRFA